MMKPFILQTLMRTFVYVSDVGFNMNAGVRLNNHNAYGSHFIYNLNPSFLRLNQDRWIYEDFLGLIVLLLSPLLYLIYMEILEPTPT